MEGRIDALMDGWIQYSPFPVDIRPHDRGLNGETPDPIIRGGGDIYNISDLLSQPPHNGSGKVKTESK